ncbi:MAG: M23 family metallopeptidase [Deltaproteobacteria bacterium]|nr:MAG: M23 family metallopeptidase [Deltaproteobacteria bacterium]
MRFRSLVFWVLVLVGAGAGAGFGWLRCEGSAPEVRADAPIQVARSGARVSLELLDAGSGLRSVGVVFTHARGEATLLERSYPGSWLRGGAARDVPERVELAIDPKALDLRDGDGILRVTARDWSLRNGLEGNEVRVELPVTIDVRPPRVEVETGLTYVQRGGAAAVVYRLSEPVLRDGVEVGDHFYAGASLSAAEPDAARRVAIFALPADAPQNPPIRVVAFDAVGNRGMASFDARVQERSFEDVSVRLPGGFLASKVPTLAEANQIDASDPAAAFQQINTRLREANEARIRQVLAGAPTERQFAGAFEQLRGSAVTSRFAERRAYQIDGKALSHATHYGYDLASTARAPVGASNAGRVVFADDLGIYGNCVLIDHGLGVSSLYGHLSRVDVAPGDRVERGQTIGLTGQTGLAGGDHLHFAILVGGTYVDPVEWWDPKWVREHIDARLEPPTP